MKKFLLLLIAVIISGQSAHAVGVNTSKYFDYGAIYSGSSFPVDVAKCANDETPSVKDLKIGESSTNNILGITERGDGEINAAVKNGGITKISHIDITEKSVFFF